MLLTPNIPDSLFSIDLKQFLDQNITKNPQEFVLQNKNFDKATLRLLAEQLKIYNKGKAKLPVHTKNYCWFTTKSYEQSSSEACALYKKEIFFGDTLLDLSGGLGVDDWAFSKSFHKIISVDIDDNLNKLVKHNYSKLKVNNVERISIPALQFLQNNQEKFDLIYIDADRRAEKQKSVLLENASPDVLGLLPKCFDFSDKIVLKLSPLIDIDYCIKKLPRLQAIYLLEYERELKEILCVVGNKNTNEFKKYVAIIHKNSILKTILFSNSVNLDFIKPDKDMYVYEPGAAIRKMRCCEQYGSMFKLGKLNNDATFLIGRVLNNEFEGRKFKITFLSVFTDKLFNHYLLTNKITDANIIARNNMLRADKIALKYKLKPSESRYLLFTTLVNGQKIFIEAERV